MAGENNKVVIVTGGSSVAAIVHIPFQTFYSASKAAVSSYSYALTTV